MTTSTPISGRSTRVHLGAGGAVIPGWTNVDARSLPGIDIVADLFEVSFDDNSVDEVYMSHTLEHLKEDEGLEILGRIYGWLKPGSGKVALAVPDFEAVVAQYLIERNLKEIRGLLLGGGKNDYDYHFSLYDFADLKRKLEGIGFINVGKYDWRNHAVGIAGIDDYSQAYLPHMQKSTGRLMSLNVEAFKS